MPPVVTCLIFTPVYFSTFLSQSSESSWYDCLVNLPSQFEFTPPKEKFCNWHWKQTRVKNGIYNEKLLRLTARGVFTSKATSLSISISIYIKLISKAHDGHLTDKV